MLLKQHRKNRCLYFLRIVEVIQKRYGEELEASDSDPYGLPFQELLQAESHKARLGIFRRIIEEEIKRLQLS